MSAVIEKEAVRKYLFLAIVAVFVILSFFVIRPYVIALVSAYVLAFLVKPVYDRLKGKIGRSFSAIACLVIIILIVVIPISAIIAGVINQASASTGLELVESVSQKIQGLPYLDKLNLQELKDKGASLLVSLITKTLLLIPGFVINLVIMLLAVYYILVNWDALSKSLKDFMPFKNKEKVSGEISKTTRGIVYGYVLIAIIEFIAAFIGFYLSGVQYYLLLPAIIALFAFIPGIGPGVVWIPTALYYFIGGEIGTGTGVVITGLIISVLIETVLFGRIAGKKAGINPLVFIVGILGGIPLFGIFGFIIGPLILVYTLKLLEAALKEGDI